MKYIFILNLTLGFNGLGKDNCKSKREAFKFCELVRLILEVWRVSNVYTHSLHPNDYAHGLRLVLIVLLWHRSNLSVSFRVTSHDSWAIMRLWKYQRYNPGGMDKCITVAPWWRHQMETFSALLALCAGNPPVTGRFPLHRPVTRSFDVFFDVRLNKWLRKQSRRRWFETPSRLTWRRCNATRTSLTGPGRYGCDIKVIIFKGISALDILSISCEIALRWMSKDMTEDKSTFVHVRVWCRQVTNHFLS